MSEKYHYDYHDSVKSSAASKKSFIVLYLTINLHKSDSPSYSLCTGTVFTWDDITCPKPK